MERTYKGNSIIDIPSSYIVVDIETTGLDYDYCDIIEISALKVENATVTDKISSLIHLPDGIELDSFITQLTGITNEMLSDAPSLETVITQFYDFVSDYILVGHNANFDVNFLYDACVRVLNQPLTNNFIDTMRFSRKLFPDNAHHRLRDTALYCNVDYKNAHRAENDCFITYSCFEAMKDKISKEFSSFDMFLDLFKYHKKYKLNVSEIVTENTEFDEEHPLFNKTVVFTGALSSCSRKDAMQKVVDVGGLVSDSVTKSTNYLVVGSFDFIKSVQEGKSSKMKKAEKMKLDGFDIEVISENAFFGML